MYNYAKYLFIVYQPGKLQNIVNCYVQGKEKKGSFPKLVLRSQATAAFVNDPSKYTLLL